MSPVAARVDVVGLPAARAARIRSSARVRAAMATLAPRVSSARLVFSDQNGPKGGLDVRCGITVSVRGRRQLHVEDQAKTPRQALDGALDKLERRLGRTVRISRDRARRPKKYFVARRLLEREG